MAKKPEIIITMDDINDRPLGSGPARNESALGWQIRQIQQMENVDELRSVAMAAVARLRQLGVRAEYRRRR